MKKEGYVICSGKQYLTISNCSQQGTTSNLSQAKVFNTYEKAENFIKCIKKTLQMHNWDIKSLNEDEQLKSLEDISYIKTQFESENFSWSDTLNNIETFHKDLKQHMDNLRLQQSQNDKEICDIYHFIEFFSLSASQGFKAYRMLKERLQTRRKIKDELQKAKYILNADHINIIGGSLKKNIESLENRKYEPRVLKELFNV